MRNGFFSRWLLGCCLLLAHVASFPMGPNGEAIATASPYATDAGMEILQKGGNAFDAAIAVSAVLSVVEPYSSGIGGGGFWLLHTVKNNKNIFLDGREKAPLKATKKMYLDKDGQVVKGASLYGPLSAAIPGQVAAWVYLSQHYAHLSLKENLAPAIRLAEEGFYVDYHYHQLAAQEDILKQLQRFKNTASIFLKDNLAPKMGMLLKQKALANTLRVIAEKGKAGFYDGDVAKKMVDAVRQAGGIWQLKDLLDYKVKIRKPLVGYYKGIKIITAPPPSAGGVALLTALNILSDYPLFELMEVQRIHYIVEAMRLAYWDRAEYLGDSDHVDVPLEHLLSKTHVRSLREYIHPDKATPSSSLKDVSAAFADSNVNTTHYSIVDKKGNRVAATQSINYIFGSSFVAGDTGVLLNDEMDDFSTKPGVKNVFQLVGSEANSISPGKRPLSSMAPTFLETKDRIGVLGTPGGSRIPTMVLLATLAFSDGKGPLSWVSLPRYHHQYLPDVVEFENDTFSHRMQKALKGMGYHLKKVDGAHIYGDMQAVEWNKKDKRLFAASDPRYMGSAAVRMH